MPVDKRGFDPDAEEHYGSVPICPYCGYNDSDDRYDGEGCHEYDCGSCGETYSCYIYVSKSYTTQKKSVKS